MLPWRKAAVVLLVGASAWGCLSVRGQGVASRVRLPRVRLIEERYEAAGDLRAKFLERYSRGPGDSTVESGTVYFSRPGRMRWEYEAPEKKLFLADGKQVWFYVPADRTVTRSKAKESADWHTPLALLVGKTKRGTFARLCSRVEEIANAVAPPGELSATLRCWPKGKDPSFRELYLEVDSGNRITRVLIREAGGVETEFRFGNWEENLSVPESFFHFQPPVGVAIVEESSILPREARQKP